MATTIDWHAHHTAPEIAETIKALTGKKPHIDNYDSPDLAKRVKEMDAVGLDVQLICQGAGIYADQLPPDQFRLFELIWKRTIASQMVDARGRTMTITIEAEDAVFQVSGKTIDFPGFLRAYVEGSDDPEVVYAGLFDESWKVPAEPAPVASASASRK